MLNSDPSPNPPKEHADAAPRRKRTPRSQRNSARGWSIVAERAMGEVALRVPRASAKSGVVLRSTGKRIRKGKYRHRERDFLLTVWEQQTEIERLRARVKDLERLQRLELQGKEEEAQIERGGLLLEQFGAELPASLLRRHLMLGAQTPEQLRLIERKYSALKKQEARVRERRAQARCERYLANFHRNKRTLPSRAVIRDNRAFLLDIFGANALKKLDERVALYKNVLLELNGVRVVAAHVDGKYTGCPKGWKQQLELKLTLEREGKTKTATFAYALLAGCKEADYARFFEAVKNLDCPAFPFLFCDFEVAIRNAAVRVWKRVTVRGCYFHYSHNLEKTRGQLERWTGARVAQATTDLLRVLPFLDGAAGFLRAYLARFGLGDDELLRLVDCKFVLYAHAIYRRRYNSFFEYDLAELTTRTNNTSEGSFSALSRASTQRMTVERVVDHVDFKFKHDLVKPWRPAPELTVFDRLLAAIQEASRLNPRSLLDFLVAANGVQTCHPDDLLARFWAWDWDSAEPFDALTLEVDEQWLDDLVAKYRRFAARKREEYQRLRKLTLSDIRSATEFGLPAHATRKARDSLDESDRFTALLDGESLAQHSDVGSDIEEPAAESMPALQPPERIVPAPAATHRNSFVPLRPRTHDTNSAEDRRIDDDVAHSQHAQRTHGHKPDN